MKFSRFLLALTGLLLFTILLHTPNDADMWWHFANGRWMAAHRHIPLTDPFTWTRQGTAWVNVFWLADGIWYLVFRLGNWPGVAAAAAGLGLATLFPYWKRSTLPPALRMAVILLAGLALSPFWTPRPQLFSFLLLALLTVKLHDWRQQSGETSLRWLPPLFLLWANLHGGFIWGVLVLLAHLAGHALAHLWREDALPWPRIRALAGWSGLAWVITLLNPSGWRIWWLPFHTLNVSLQIQEWQSPDFHQFFLHPALWLFLLYVALLGLQKRAAHPAPLLATLGLAYMAFISQRNLAPLVVLLTGDLLLWLDWPLPASQQESAQPPLPRWTQAVNAALLLALGAFGLLRWLSLTSPSQVHQTYPRGAVTWLQGNRPPGQLFNEYNWGGYLIWNLPQYPVAVDGRADLHGQEGLDAWLETIAGRRTLDPQVNIVLIPPERPLAQALREDPGWRLAYQDETALIFLRNAP